MADITMCKGEGCELRESCYRYTAPIDRYGQSVFTKTPDGKPCSHFWDNTGRRDGRKIGMWWDMTIEGIVAESVEPSEEPEAIPPELDGIDDADIAKEIMMEELKPCPFCGCAAGLTKEKIGYIKWVIGCSTKSCRGHWRESPLYDNSEEAEKAWNRRNGSGEKTVKRIL